MGVIWCLHGFLGRPDDWSFLPFSHRAVDLFAGEEANPGPDDSLIGYSMGGRLALRLLERTTVRRAVIVSAGLNAPDTSRLEHDETWARRFESEPWDSLIDAWNAQPVFQSDGSHSEREEGERLATEPNGESAIPGEARRTLATEGDDLSWIPWLPEDEPVSAPFERHEGDYDRAALAHALRAWSPAVLPPPRLESIETPILWIAGELDRRYVEVGREAVDRLPNADLWICPRAGHRVPWEQPQAFVARLREFLDLH